MKFFEDIRVGETVEIGSHVFTAEDIKTFAQRFDPQPFHVDDEAAARSHFGRLCASGWHTACVWMRLHSKPQGPSMTYPVTTSADSRTWVCGSTRRAPQ